MFAKSLHKKTKGDIAEMRIAADLLEKGWHVLFPYGENNRYDLVAEKSGKFIRVQVKYVTPKNGSLDVNCRSSNNWNVVSYTAKEIDYIGVFDSDSENIYYIPSGLMNKNLFKIRLKPSKNNQRKRINLSEDFSEIR
ncbi:MAG: group I intron-associated PD-(D/E)XK endonuclease [bacterium]